MNIVNKGKRVIILLWKRRAELATYVFWQRVFRVVGSGISFFLNRVSEKDFNLNLKALEKRPWNISIELTNICNSNCIFCAYRYQTREKMIMKHETFLKVLDEYCEIGGGELMFEVTVGEPTVDKNFLERIKEARCRKEITVIETITNGIILDRVGIEELLNSGITRIKISISAFDEETYKKIYRNEDYNRMRHNIYNLLKLNKELGEPVEIILSFRSNLTMKKTFALPDYQTLRRYPHKVEFILDFDDWSGLIKQEDLLDGMYLGPPIEQKNEPCFWFYHGPVIYVDGKIGLCGCRDLNANSELIVGDIKTDRLIDVWQSNKVKELRKRFYRGDIPEICKKCTNYGNLNFYRTKEGNERRYFISKVFN